MTALTQYEAVRAAIVQASQVEDILPLLDEFEIAKLRAKQINDHAILAEATEFEMRAERRLGEIIKAAKAAGLFKQGRQPEEKKSADELFPRGTLADAGIDKKLSVRSQELAQLEGAAFEEKVKGVRERITSNGAKIIDAGPINGARSVMGSRQEPDDSLDYFPTPPWATRALMTHVLPKVFNYRLTTAWEPACGEGHIAEVLREFFEGVTATDIFDYGYNDDVGDFLKVTSSEADWIITNPPFGEQAILFVQHAFKLAREGVAMFFRSQWAVEGIERYEQIFRDNPPTQCAFFVERVNLCKGRWEPDGTTATAYCWLVWIQGEEPRPPLWIPHGCREALTKADDRERFTAHPVIKRQ
jgi:hypothetical protein